MTYQPSDKRVTVSRDIPASPEQIFDVLVDPTRHQEIDGSEMVQGAKEASQRLALGSKFGMSMKMGPVPYGMSNEVIAFEENREIGWRHFGHHVWHYLLEPIEGGTRVTESFDWGVARFSPFYEWVGYPDKHKINIERTLERLEAVVS